MVLIPRLRVVDMLKRMSAELDVPIDKLLVMTGAEIKARRAAQRGRAMSWR